MGFDKMAVAECLPLIWIISVVTSCVCAEHPCPKGGQINLDGLRCYWLSASGSSWLEARDICREMDGGDLATVDSPKVQTFIHNSFSLKASEWVWLRNGTRGGFHQSDRLGTERDQQRDRDQRLCTQMTLGSTGQWRTVACEREHLFLCEREMTVSLPSLGSYLTGVPLMTGIYTVSQLQVLSTPLDIGQQRVEMMLFPGLWFSHEGQVLSVDLVTQPGEHLTLAKVQILRPYCSPNHHLVPPGCSSLFNPFSCCSLVPLCNTTGGCANGQYWCHLLETCLPVTSPCSPYHSPAGGRTFPLPPRYPAMPPFYHLVADMRLRLPPNSELVHLSVTLQEQGISVYPDDILAIQHTRKAGGFLNCLGGSDSPWRQSYLSLPGAEWGGWWDGGLSAQPSEGQWVDGVVCDLRVLSVDTLHHYAVSPMLSTGQSELSGYTHTGTISTPVRSMQTPIPVKAQSPVSGIRVVHPILGKENQIHLAVNVPTLIVIKILSGQNATSSWSAPVFQTGVPFLPSCPSEMPELLAGCERGTPDTWFSHVSLVLSSPGAHTLNITALNAVNSQSVSVRVQAHQPVMGLSLQPHGFLRVLVEIPQLFRATVASGLSVKYTWVIDNLVKFAYTGEAYSVVFKKPAEYKLKVIAENPVSSQFLEVKLTADMMTPLADPSFFSTKEVIAVCTSDLYIFRVKVDISIGVTIRWNFGDNSSSVNHTIPAPLESRDGHLDWSVRQTYLQDSIRHSYLLPGDYILRVQAYNKYDQIEKAVTLKVRPLLARLLVFPVPEVPEVNQTFLIEASPWPSPYGILYTWNFGDGSKEVKGFHSKISHVVRTAGTYNITVCANNTLSVMTTLTSVEIVEHISGLRLSCRGPNELNSVTEIKGKVFSGTRLFWSFDLGDGFLLRNHSESSISHIYKSPGNYTVRVTVTNPVSQASQSINVEIYKLALSGILPSDCLLSGREITLRALATGNVSVLSFHWSFDDGTPLSVRKGHSTVTHTYSSPGIYQTNVTAFSTVGSAFYQASICVEALITGLTLHSTHDAVAVGEEVCFDAFVYPSQHNSYQFLWYNSSLPASEQSHYCFVFKEEGIQEIVVVANNKVSNKMAKAIVVVQRPVTKMSLEHEGNSDAVTVNKSSSFWVEACCGTNVTVEWDFGDGSQNKQGQNQSHVFSSAGTFCVTVTAFNAVSRDSVTVEVGVLVPVSNLVVHTNQPFAEVGEETLITAVADVMDNVNFYWSVDPFTPPKLETSEFRYVFHKAGVYKIKVTAQNLISQQEATTSIEVLERIHGVHITSQSLISMRYLQTQENVLLTALVSHGSNLTYQWLVHQDGINRTYGDGEHFQIFTESPGDISVELIASNRLGRVDCHLLLRAVECVSGVRFSTPVDTVVVGKPERISASVETGTDLQYLWYLDSDLPPIKSDLPFVLHVFRTLGSFDLRVSVSNILGSSDATKQLTVQEDVSEVDFEIDGKTNPFFVTSNSLLLLHGSVRKGNILCWEWIVSSKTGKPVFIGNNQSVGYSFLDVGVHRVSLNASNDISWQTVSHLATVQDAIQGLTLNVSRAIVCADDPITFTPIISKGSDVLFTLQFGKGNTFLDLVKNNWTTSTLPVGNHSITAKARNYVSSSVVSLTVQVVKRVTGLSLTNCCSVVLEVLKEVSFQALVNRGSPTNYHWIFHLEAFKPSQATGQNVLYSSLSNGSLSVTVEADNGLCSQSITKTAVVQWPVKDVKLIYTTPGAFVDHPITFLAITDGGSTLTFKWDFGDSGERSIITGSNTVDHKFNTPGRYVVQVTVFNNVSQVSSQLFTEVRKLECSQPQVYLVQEQSKILRSRPSYFEASVDLKGCISYKTSYMWEVFRGPGCIEEDRVPLNTMVDVTTPLLSLPKHALEVGHYCLRFTTVLQGTPLQQHKTTRVSVVHSQLVPLIKGGSQRFWSSHSNLVLDGTESHDPDSGMEKEDELLQYHWDYVTQNSTVSSSPVSPSLDHPVQSDSSTLIMPSSALQPGRVYLFTLTVQKLRRPPISTTQSVTVYEAPVIPVSVECISCSSLFSFHVSHSRPIALSGRCVLCDDSVKYKWSAENQKGEALKLNEVTTSTGDSSSELVIRPGVLQDGLNYIFSLNASQPTQWEWGSASVTLLPNHPPHGGSCTLTPDGSIHLLETLVTYNCSGWVDEDSEPAQLIYTLQVALCPNTGPLCPLLTLYRGTQHTFGTLAPLGTPRTEDNMSIISVLVQIEDNLGATVTALKRTLMVLLPVSGQGLTAWLRNKSQSELWALVQQGNPQEVIPYSIALTSQLNQVDTDGEEELQDRMVIRGNVTQALASLPVSTLQDAAQISSALAQSMAVPSEVVCEGCQVKVLKTMEKMISVIREQTGPGDVTPIDTGRNILHILGSCTSAVLGPEVRPGLSGDSRRLGASDSAVSALGQVGDLMRSLMRSRVRGEEALSLSTPQISAVGVRGDPTSDLLCTDPSSHCQFHIPPALSSQLRESGQDVVQILLGMEVEGNPFIPTAHPPISTALAAMEFATPQGQPIPIANLTSDRAIRVTLHNHVRQMDRERSPEVNITLPHKGSVNFTVKAVETDPHAGLYIAFNFSLIPGSGQTGTGHVRIFVDDHPGPPLSQHSLIRELSLSLSAEVPVVEDTIFLTPLLNGSAQELQVSLSCLLSGGTVQVSVCVFSSLCQYFSLERQHWSSQGLSPLSGSSPHTARCLTQHLTMFGASLFVHPNAILLLPPSEGPVRNVVVGIVCGVLLLIHLLVGLIAHKLDHLESLRLSCVPLCGPPGRYQYRVLVKTGWGRGSGTTAHIGISLYGVNKSGSRHLQREGAFQRSRLDDFQLETDANLGEIWKIRIWHDNTGLDPSWFLQHVIVWDIQTDNMFFFLVEDWLSVENEKNSGMVEKVVLASCPQELQQFQRILRSQLVFGLLERHLWMSLWERPAHSSFTRAQRVTCCALLMHLYLAVGAVWYGAVGSKDTSGPISAQLLVNPETILVGITVAAVVFPLQSIFCFLFRKTRSKVTVEVTLPPSPVSHTVEMDVYFSHPKLSCSSFLSLPGGPESSILDGESPCSESMECNKLESEFWNASGNESGVGQWLSCDSVFGLPELTGPARLLKRKRALLQLRLASPTSGPSSPEPSSSHNLQHNALTLSEEELLKSIAADISPASSGSSAPTTSDSGRYSPNETTLSDLQESLCSEWSELSLDKPAYETGLYKSPSSLSVFTVASTFLPSPSPDTLSTCSHTRIGVARGEPGLMLPSWILRVAYLLVALVLGTCLAVVGLYGSRFSSSVVLMWLISSLSAFLTSALLLEPLKVCVQALILAAVVRPVDPEVEDRLGQETIVRRMSEEEGSKVRPPCGYGLLQAKEEARKVRTLRALMRSCMVNMLFLLVVLLVNYQENVQDVNGRLLHSAVKHSLLTAPPGQPNYMALSGWTEAWQWMDQTLVPYLHHNPSLLLVGLPRLQKVHSQDFCERNLKESLEFGHPSLLLADPVSSHSRPERQRGSPPSNTGRPLPWLWSKGQCGVYSVREETVLGNSSRSTHQILSDLQRTNWTTTQTEAMFVEFTQYHRETNLFVTVTMQLECTQTEKSIPSISIQPFHMPPSSSGPDLQIALMVVLLLFGLSFLSIELCAMVRERGQYLCQGWRWLQLLVALLSLATAALRLSFLSTATACLSQHRSQPHTYTDFHSAALLARTSCQLSAVLLTLLVLKMVGTLRFLRRWVVFGRVLQQAWREIFGVAFLLVLLLLLFSHTGNVLFSGSVEGFRTMGQASRSLLSLLRGRVVRRRLCKRHPVVGPLYCMSVLGVGFWVLGRLCGAVLLRTYRTVQAEMYRPPMEPQDYEMVEFFIKRLKLWMGLSKTKEFRHRVKFEGMVSPPSRSSQLSALSTPISPAGPRLVSSASSAASEVSTLSDGYDVQFYLDRLLPSVDGLLACFDRVNQATDEVYGIELQLHGAQSRIAQKQRLQESQGVVGRWYVRSPPLPPHGSPLSPPLPGPQPPPSSLHCSRVLPRRRATHSESSALRPSSRLSKAGSHGEGGRLGSHQLECRRLPRCSAWHSGTSHSADVAQRSPKAQSGCATLVRPRSEEGDRRTACDRVPVKKRAWHPEGSEMEKD